MTTTFFSRTAVAVALIAGLAACAGSPEKSAPAATPAPAPAPAPPPPAPEPPLPEATLGELRKPAMGDLDAIAARGYLRVLVEATRTNYFVKDGLQGGAAYSAGKRFEAFLRTATGKRELQVAFLPVPVGELIKALNEGRGDVVANILITPDREEPTVTLVPALTNIREFVVTAPGQPRFVSIEDLEGRSIHVRKSSAHYASLERINRRLKQINKPGCTIVAAAETLSDEDLLARVDAGLLPATLVDSHVAAMWKPTLPHVSINEEVAISQDAVVAWAIRKDSPKLLDQVNAFAKANGPAALFGPAAVQKR